MKVFNPLLYKLVRQLTKQELRQLKKYLRSPFVTHREDISSMFNCLSGYLYKGKNLPTKEELFAQTYINDEYDGARLRSTMSELHTLIEQYIVWMKTSEYPVKSRLSLAAFYRQRNLGKHFRRTMRGLEHVHKKQPLRNPDYFQNELQFQIENALFETANKRTKDLNLQAIDNTMDVLYLTQKLRHVCTLLSHRAVYQAEYQFGLLPTWIDILEDSHFLKIPAIALYYYCYRFLTEAYSQVYFKKFRDELSAYSQHFPQEELRDLYRAAINFCIRKLNEGDMEYTREGWELYQEGIREGYFFENNQLSRFTFDNIVGFGLRLKEFEAVKEFINTHNLYLDANYQESTMLFNLARLEYEQKNYDKALQLLHSSNPKDLVNQLITKTLVLKLYMELEEFDLLDHHLNNFRNFTRRRELSDYHRENFRNIINFTRKIAALAPYDKMEREKLRKAIENTAVFD
jgi:hypothetical protein